MCVNRDACDPALDGGFIQCRQLGDDNAICQDNAAPLNDYYCDCSTTGLTDVSGDCVDLDACVEVFALEAPLTGVQACHSSGDASAIHLRGRGRAWDKKFVYLCSCSAGYSDFEDSVSMGVCSDHDPCGVTNLCAANGGTGAVCNNMVPPRYMCVRYAQCLGSFHTEQPQLFHAKVLAPVSPHTHTWESTSSGTASTPSHSGVAYSL
jgi:hypothetical protein